MFVIALVFRCLQALMLLIPDIKAHFRKKLTPKKCVLLQQFDQVQEVWMDRSCDLNPVM